MSIFQALFDQTGARPAAFRVPDAGQRRPQLSLAAERAGRQDRSDQETESFRNGGQ